MTDSKAPAPPAYHLSSPARKRIELLMAGLGILSLLGGSFEPIFSKLRHKREALAVSGNLSQELNYKMEKNAPVVLNSGGGKELKVGNSKICLKLLSQRTENKFSITEYELLPHFPGPPAHKHKEFEHAWYVLAGELSIRLDDEETTLKEGGFVFIPKRVVHAFSNGSDSMVRLLAVDTPGGFEDYYDDLQTAFGNGQAPDPDTFRKIQLKYDTYPPDYLFE